MTRGNRQLLPVRTGSLSQHRSPKVRAALVHDTAAVTVPASSAESGLQRTRRREGRALHAEELVALRLSSWRRPGAGRPRGSSGGPTRNNRRRGTNGHAYQVLIAPSAQRANGHASRSYDRATWSAQRANGHASAVTIEPRGRSPSSARPRRACRGSRSWPRVTRSPATTQCTGRCGAPSNTRPSSSAAVLLAGTGPRTCRGATAFLPGTARPAGAGRGRAMGTSSPAHRRFTGSDRRRREHLAPQSV